MNSRNGAVLAREVSTAFDSASRRRGLLGRTSFEDESVIVIAPCNAVHTFFMKFPIDIVFAQRSGVVLKTCSRVPPWRISMAIRAYAVLELPPGTLARYDVVPGDVLQFSR